MNQPRRKYAASIPSYQGCKWGGGTQRNAVPVGVFTGGTPFRLFCVQNPESRPDDMLFYEIIPILSMEHSLY
jgi:hypothetical protein